MALFLIISVPAFERRAICPFIHSKAMFLTVFEVTCKGLSITIPHKTLSSYLVAREVALVCPLILETVFTVPIFFSSNELSLVATHLAPFCPDLAASPIRIIACPFPFVTVAAFFKDKCSIAFGLFLGKLTFIIPTLRTDKATFSIRNSF
jgi:hypothetical protein